MEIQRAHRRYGAYAGFVTTPKYFDDSPQQFLQVETCLDLYLQQDAPDPLIVEAFINAVQSSPPSSPSSSSNSAEYFVVD